MKHNQRLDYNRLAEALGERGLVEPEALQQILHQCMSGSGLFAELLVQERHLSDWELSRVVSEVFGMPFLPVDLYEPAPSALDGLDPDFLIQHLIVPLDRWGKLLTVAMPGLTPSAVLGQLSRDADVEITAFVGSVESNRRWLHHQFPSEPAVQAPSALELEVHQADSSADLMDVGVGLEESSLNLAQLEDDWGDLFDQGDAAVLMELEGQPSSTSGTSDLPELPSLDSLND